MHSLQIQNKGMGIGGMRTKLPLIIEKTRGVHFLKEDENEDQENPSCCLPMHQRQTNR